MTVRRLIRPEDLIGQKVRTADGRVVGRIEDLYAEHPGSDHQVTEYHLGPGALLERLAAARRWFGGKRKMVIVRWDQLDIHNPERPTLTCPADELKRT
jgi:sporulation protein YlmC with PRC-barrel domain